MFFLFVRDWDGTSGIGIAKNEGWNKKNIETMEKYILNNTNNSLIAQFFP